MKICPDCFRTDRDQATSCADDGARLLRLVGSDDARIGSVLAERYIVLERLVAGRLGVLYRGYQTTTERAVAIRMMRRAGADSTLLERFRRGARLMAKLRSPHTVTVYDFGQLGDGTMWFAMELIPGCTLAELLARAPCEPSTARSILVQVCLSLEEAHRHGLVHRDLKPSNVMIERSGSGHLAKVADFGMAKILDERVPGLTEPGATLGSPGYMSPEQAMGQPVGPEADIYSMGCMAFEMLAGRLPFEGAVTAVLTAHCTQPPPSLNDVLGYGSPALEAFESVIDTCLEKSPSDRFGTARELRMALELLPD